MKRDFMSFSGSRDLITGDQMVGRTSSLIRESATDIFFEKRIKQRHCVQTTKFNIFMATAILANCLVIACECQDIGNSRLEPLYRKLELAFMAIYVIEIGLRIWQLGMQSFFCGSYGFDSDWGWNWFDFAITIIAAADFFCTEALNMRDANASVARAARLLRVLRIMRVFRILKFLKDVEYTLVSTLGSVVRVAFLVIMIDFIGAVVITHLLHDTEDDMVHEMFGKLSNSMYHLFEVMVDGMGAMYAHTESTSESLDGVVVITGAVMAIYPQMWIFWVAFVFVGTISLMALVPAVIVQLNMRDAEIARNTQSRTTWERRVESQKELLENLFKSVDKDRSNNITRQEAEEYLFNPMFEDNFKHANGTLSTNDVVLVDEEGEGGFKVDKNQLRMEFTRVYDALEAEGRDALSLEEFIDAFREMREKPTHDVVLLLQEELFNLRHHMLEENKMLRKKLNDSVIEVKNLRDAIVANALPEFPNGAAVSSETGGGVEASEARQVRRRSVDSEQKRKGPFAPVELLPQGLQCCSAPNRPGTAVKSRSPLDEAAPVGIDAARRGNNQVGFSVPT